MRDEEKGESCTHQWKLRVRLQWSGQPDEVMSPTGVWCEECHKTWELTGQAVGDHLMKTKAALREIAAENQDATDWDETAHRFYRLASQTLRELDGDSQ